MNKRIVTHWMLVSVMAFLMLGGCSDNTTPEQRLAAATQAHATGDYRTALIELKNLLRQAPDNVEARILLADTSMKLGDAPAGEKELARAESLGAPPERIYAKQLKALLMQSKHQQLIDEFDGEKLQTEPQKSAARIYYANSLYATGDTISAAEEFTALAASGPNADVRSDAMLGQAEMAKAAGDLSKADEFIQQALAESPGKVSVLIAQGQLLLANRDFAAALDIFSTENGLPQMEMTEEFVFRSGEVEAALGIEDIEHAKRAANSLYAISPEHPVTNYLLARVAFIDGDKEMSFQRIQDVTGRFPSFRPAMFLHGALSLERGEYQQAEMFLSNVVSAQPGNSEARKLLAESLVRQNKDQEAVAVLNQAIAAGTTDQSIVTMLGRVQLRTGNQDANIDLLLRSLEQNPNDENLMLTLAAAYIAAGRADQAVKLYESSAELVDQSDRTKRGMVLKLLAAIQSEDIELANSHAKGITEQFSDDREMINLVAGLYMAQGKHALAEEIYQSMIDQDATDSKAVINLGRIKIREENYSAAIELFTNYLKDNPDDFDVRLSMAFAMQSKGDLEDAFAAIEDTYNRHSGEELPALIYTRALLVSNKLDKAQEVASQILAVRPESAQANFGMGLVQFESREYELALNAFRKANELNPDSLEVLLFKARSEARLKRYAQAIKSYKAVRSINPDLFEASRSLVMLEMRAGNRARAQDVMRDMQKRYPGDPRMLEIEGDLRAGTKDLKAAAANYAQAYEQAPSRELAVKLAQLSGEENTESLSYLRRWLEQSPDDVDIRLLLAQRLQGAGKQQEATAEYEQVLQRQSANVLALNNLAWISYESGETSSLGSAVELSKKAFELRPEAPQIADTYGWILFRSGEIKEGGEVLAQAYERARDANSPATRDIGYHYAVALKEGGDRTRAKNLLEQLLNRQGPFEEREEAQQLLDSLQ